MHSYDDAVMYEQYPDARRVYDKLYLYTKLGYTCGPAGLPLPPGRWFMKPQINLYGMGVGAREVLYADEIPPGYIWMPYFEGEHYSVDYHRSLEGGYRQGLTVRGVYRDGRPFAWVKEDQPFGLQGSIHALFVTVPHINVEFIGGKIIEVHLRSNPDFHNREDAEVAMPVWEDQLIKPESAGGHLRTPRVGMVYTTKAELEKILRGE